LEERTPNFEPESVPLSGFDSNYLAIKANTLAANRFLRRLNLLPVDSGLGAAISRPYLQFGVITRG
jgi:hypothetical protein